MDVARSQSNMSTTLIRFGSVYLVTNLVNGKQYVGQTTQRWVCQRWSTHTTVARQGADTALARAIRKYGQDQFEIREIAVCADRQSLDAAEDTLIAAYDSLVPNGYNLMLGNGGHNHHPDTIERFKQRVPWQKGKPSKTKGIPRSDETKAKIAAAQRGKPRPPEGIAKMAATKRGKASGKARLIIDQDGFIYGSMTAAALLNDLPVSSVSRCVNSKLAQVRGFTFTYLASPISDAA